MVFSSIYPVDANDYEELATAMEKLKLNDASLIYEKDSSVALGFGFRCGFLGLLHLESRPGTPRARVRAVPRSSPPPRSATGSRCRTAPMITIDNPALYPDPTQIEQPRSRSSAPTIIIPERYMGAVMTLCLENRGEQHQLPVPGRASGWR